MRLALWVCKIASQGPSAQRFCSSSACECTAPPLALGLPACCTVQWQIDPVMLPFHTAVRSGRFAGYAGPSRRPAAEAISKYILVDMYAKAVQGMAPADAVKWAHGELVKIYA